VKRFWTNANNGRCYEVEVYQDLLDFWVIRRKWWGRYRAGCEITLIFENFEDVSREIERLAKIRTSHGYCEIDLT
jgi:hypothetical protein